MTVEEALKQFDALRQACDADPGLWNILAAEQEWARYGDACDPLSPHAPERELKALQRDIYLEVWGAALAKLLPRASALAAGGGTGRFAQALVARGYRVELVDISPEAVRRAREHLGPPVPCRVGDIAEPGVLRAGAFDLVMAVEVACYATEPARVMSALANALRPGGALLYSVEASPGALLGDSDLTAPESAVAILDEGVVTLPGMKHVSYYTRQQAAQLGIEAGLAVSSVEGVCYVPDGPLRSLVDGARLSDPAHLDLLRSVERRCREHPALRELPRAWAVTATRR
jgi:SAM-dependent methyltransferase